jgi:hypothetical protein
MQEIKFIILRDKTGHLRHFKSDWLHHYTLARDNGFNSEDILEAGIILDNHLFILECQLLKHLDRRRNKFILGNDYQDIRLTQWLKGRELESQLYYSKARIGVLPEGD